MANFLSGTILEFSFTGASKGTFASGLSHPEGLAFAPTLDGGARAGVLTLAGIGLAAVLGYARLRRGRATPAH